MIYIDSSLDDLMKDHDFVDFLQKIICEAQLVKDDFCQVYGNVEVNKKGNNISIEKR